MSNDRLLLIVTRWKNEAYQLSRQLEYIRKDYFLLQQKLNKNNSLKTLTSSSRSTTNENMFEQFLINVNQSSVSDQISFLCNSFIQSLKRLLCEKIIEEKKRSTIIKSPPIIETIETNIKEIGNLIKKMNEQSSKEFIQNEKSN